MLSRLTPVYLLFLLILSPLTHAVPQRLPLEHFASLPDVSQVRLSPDGKHVSALVRVEGEKMGGTAVVVFGVDSGKQEIITFTDNETYLIRFCRWANNDTLFVSARYPAARYGTPTDEFRLILADIHTKTLRNAVPPKYQRRFAYMPQMQDYIVDILPNDNDHFLLGIDGREPGERSVFKVSLKKNRMSLVQASRKNVWWWYTDRQQQVRLGISRKDTWYQILHRTNAKAKWEPLWKFEALSENEIWPLGFGHDPNELYVRALHEGREAIFRVDLASPARALQLVYANQHYDVDGELVYSPLKKKIVGIDTDIDNGDIFWDEDYEALINGVNQALPETENVLLMMSANEHRYLVHASSDRNAGTYMVGDRDSRKLVPVADRYSRLRPELMAAKQRVVYKARDGLEIEAFLTLPIDYQAGQKIPAIIHPHGGPISFDNKGFDYWTQFLANRGYAVLQMNFRGSAGYGFDFMQAGLGSWGLAMQDDVEDATRWLIAQGYADAKRICSVGGSYGGYAALMGAVKSPDLYRCVISFAGVSDLAQLLSSARGYTHYEIAKKQLGDKRRDLKERSPLHYADKISAPVLLIHGSKDRTVPVKQSRKMHKALQKHGVAVEYLELEDGDHYLSNNDHRLATFRAMEKFLDTHLGVMTAAQTAKSY